VALAMIEPAHGAFPGAVADLVALDPAAPALAGHDAQTAVDAWLFSGNRPLVDVVWAGGVQVVEGGRHRDRDATAAAYRDAVAGLLTA
jgi:formimidoylglutamate deiminase